MTEEKQASNLVGAFTYADANWSWMGPIFIFNLDFNQAPWLDDCDQMRYYSVMGRTAETALTNMPKNPGSLVGQLELLSAPWLLMAVDEQPFTATVQIGIANAGWQAFTYTATVVTGTAAALNDIQVGISPDMFSIVPLAPIGRLILFPVRMSQLEKVTASENIPVVLL